MLTTQQYTKQTVTLRYNRTGLLWHWDSFSVQQIKAQSPILQEVLSALHFIQPGVGTPPPKPDTYYYPFGTLTVKKIGSDCRQFKWTPLSPSVREADCDVFGNGTKIRNGIPYVLAVVFAYDRSHNEKEPTSVVVSEATDSEMGGRILWGMGVCPHSNTKGEDSPPFNRKRRIMNKENFREKIWETLRSFQTSGEMLNAIDDATRAFWDGSYLCLELFPDGSQYRVLPENDIEKSYKTPGIIVSIPPLLHEEWHDEESRRFYDNAIELLFLSIEESLVLGEF